MSIFEILLGPITKQIAQILAIVKDIQQKQAVLESGLAAVGAELAEIKAQLDRIEEDIVGSEAVKLIVSMGVPEEQSLL